MHDKNNILAGLRLSPQVNNIENDPSSSQVSQSSNQADHEFKSNRRARSGGPINNNNNNNNNTSTMTGCVCNSINGQHKLKQRFSVIKKLGKGTYGKVQLAINKATGQEVAIKTIKKTKIESKQDLERVRREIQIMSSIEHPHIIHIYEVFENKDKIVLVMQYAPGGELYEYVSQAKNIGDREARRLFRQIATAIFYCHKNRICHRDLKLENILLDEKNNAKLADFGLSNVFDKRRQLNTFCGSPLYASPEIVLGSPYEGPEVDCWSLGVLLYTLVYGAMPFDGSNFKRLVKQISEAVYFEPESRSQASPLIRRLLCADPRNRANIIDICTDPWVNGTLSIPRSSFLFNQTITKQQDDNSSSPCNSLLQVAQDMANLTPVRVDILMGLLPHEIGSYSTEAHHQISTNNNKNKNKNKNNDNQARSRNVSQDNLVDNNSIMEPINCNAPVASYVVRDLEQEAQVADADKKPRIENHSDMNVDCTHETSAQTVIHSNDVAPNEVENMTFNQELQINHEQVKMIEQPIEEEVLAMCPDLANEIQEQISHIVDVGPNNVATMEQVEVIQETSTPETRTSLACQSEAMLDDPQSAQNQPIQTLIQPQSKIQESEEDSKQEIQDSGVTAKKDDQDTNELRVEQQREESKSPASEVSTGEKPKKVKKIIVVKKKKKKKVSNVNIENECDDTMTKREQETEPEKEPQKANDIEEQSSAISKQKEEQAKPETKNQIDEREIVQSTSKMDTNESGSMRESRATRRRSTLVADMSDKLMQALAADARSGPSSPNANIKMEQAALMGQVNVAYKKEEFERRASLLQVEPNIEHLQNRRRSTEPSDDGDRFASKLTINDDQLSGNERTDSVETLKPPIDEENNIGNLIEQVSDDDISTGIMIVQNEEPIRSELEIKLQPNDRQSAEKTKVSSRAPSPQINLALVPITRSYKKVTFTEDGACITETGKIYASKDDDGTMRRVERKSKVTHYPAEHIRSSSEFGSGSGIDKTTMTTLSESSEQFSYSSSNAPANKFDSSWNMSKTPFEQIPNFAKRSFIRAREDNGTRKTFNLAERSLIDDAQFQLNFDETNSVTSTCSSGSTDIFDDIFDNWTGAISMFERGARNIRGIASPRHHHHGRHLRRLHQQNQFGRFNTNDDEDDGDDGDNYRRAGSEKGSFRCESAEPGYRESTRTDKYNQDHVQSRPASAFGSARYQAQSDSRYNLFFNSGSDDEPIKSRFDQLFASNEQHDSRTREMMREVGLKHSMLRKELAKQRKRIWCGSTPSLISENIFHSQNPSQSQSQSQSKESQLRRDEIIKRMPSADMPPLPPQIPSSYRSRTFKQTASPLDHHPIRKNTTNLNDIFDSLMSDNEKAQEIATRATTIKSQSKSSIISSRLSQINLEEVPPAKAESLASFKNPKSASFIELKQGPNSQSKSSRPLSESARSQELDHQESVQLFTRTKSQSKTCLIGDNNDEIQLIKTTVITQPNSTSIEFKRSTSQSQVENADKRIQNWLQESSSNFSSSSGSKSSASYAPSESTSNFTARESSFANIFQSQLNNATSLMKPPIARAFNETISSNNLKRILIPETMANSDASNVRCQRIITTTKTTTSRPSSPTREQASPNCTSTTTKTTVTIQMSSGNQQRSTSGLLLNKSLNSYEDLPNTAEFELDSQSQSQSQSHSQSQSQSQSQSTSSSLLDQLRTKGYRSLINKRMVDSASPVGNCFHSTQLLSNLEHQLASSSMSSHDSSGFLLQDVKNTSQLSEKADSSSIANRATLDKDDKKNCPNKTDVFQKGDPGDLSNGTAETTSIENFGGRKEQKSAQMIGMDSNSNSSAKNELQVDSLDKDCTLDHQHKDKEDDDQHDEGDDDDDDDDDQIKLSKANVKAQQDRMRETELFLKNLAIVDEETQSKRREMFSLNEHVIRSKLNGLTGLKFSSSLTNGLDKSMLNNCAFYSAPIHSEKPIWTPRLTSSNITSSRRNFEHDNSYEKGLFENDKATFCNYFDRESIPERAKMRAQSLAPTERANVSSFIGSDRPSVPIAKWSLCSKIDDDNKNHHQFNYKRRSLSITRQPLSLSENDDDDWSNMKTEYQRSYASSRVFKPTTSYRSDRSDSTILDKIATKSRHRSIDDGKKNSTIMRAKDALSGKNNDDDDDDDEKISESMDAYRPSNYVPKFEPKSHSSRAHRRSSLCSSINLIHRNNDNHRSSFDSNNLGSQVGIATDDSLSSRTCPIAANENEAASNCTKSMDSCSTENRLSELEQRIQENKLRREKLLSSELDSTNVQSRKSSSTDKSPDELTRTRSSARQSSPIPALKASLTSNPSSRCGTRSSRLESMEARIKRRSFYVNVDSPSSSIQSMGRHESLDRWQIH